VRQNFLQVLIPQFVVVYSSEKITKIGQYMPLLSQKINVSRFLWPTVYKTMETLSNKSKTHTQINLSTVSEPSEMKPNLIDQTCELLK